MDDQQIVQYYFDRDEQAIALSAQKYGALCHRVAMNILDSREDSEECVNDTYLQAWNAIPPERPTLLGAYLCRITRNLAINRYRADHRDKRGGGQAEAVLEELRECLPGGDMDEHLDELVLRDAINKFLRGQLSRNRAIFLRRYWAMERVEDIAMDLGLRRGQTATILYRMRRELKKHLEKEGINL